MVLIKITIQFMGWGRDNIDIPEGKYDFNGLLKLIDFKEN
uniref:Uncharacterized protein n=1 Tax=Heterorhabditis bacteriophora TaxID=37862 RepID=A0A1I7WBA8_HETBA